MNGAMNDAKNGAMNGAMNGTTDSAMTHKSPRKQVLVFHALRP